MGDAGHQIGAGLLIGGGLLLLGQQVLLHVVEGGADGGKFIPPAVVHRLGEVPLLDPTGGLGQSVYRLEELSHLPAGKKQAEQHDDHHGRGPAEEHG